jgi:hypothetical protein
VSASVEKTLEKILSFYTQEKYMASLLEAKEFYFNKTGRLDEEDAEYESRMNCFYDWYLTEFSGGELSEPPVQNYFKQTDPNEEEVLGEVNYSLFEFNGKNFRKQFVLKDILHGTKITFDKDYLMPSFVKDDLFTGRVITHEDKNYLMNGLCLLPKEVRSLLKKRAKKVLKEKDIGKEVDFLLTIESLKERARCYSHLEAKQVFVFED